MIHRIKYNIEDLALDSVSENSFVHLNHGFHLGDSVSVKEKEGKV